MITRSAPRAAAPLLSATSSAKPSSSTRCRVAAERAVATMVRTIPCWRAARRMEEPIRPLPMTAKRSKRGSSLLRAFRMRAGSAIRACPWPARSRSLLQELGKRRDDQPIGFLGADAHAQRVGQLVGTDLAQDQAARGEECVGILGGAALGGGKMDQHEV